MVSSNRDRLQTLIADIDSILRKMNSRLAWWSSGETRRVLERVRSYLDSQLQQESGAQAQSGSAIRAGAIARHPEPRSLSSPSDRPDTPEAAAQAVWQGLVQDMMALRATSIQPLQAEIRQLQQERLSLSEEIRQLEQRRRHYSTLAGQQTQQQQAIAEFLQALMGPLQDSLNRQVSQTLEHLETQLLTGETTSQSPLTALDADLLDETTSATPPSSRLLHPQERLQRLRMLQAESDRLLLSLDSTLSVVFEALERNVHSYNDSLSQGLDKMHRLGQQGELMFSALVNHLAQLLGQETSSYLQSSLRLLGALPKDSDTESGSERKTPSDDAELEGDRVEPDSTPPPAKSDPSARDREAEPKSPESPPKETPPSSQVSAPSPFLSAVQPLEESLSMLQFPFAGSELYPADTSDATPEDSLENPEIPDADLVVSSDAPSSTARSLSREEISQRNFEAAAELAETDREDENAFESDDLFLGLDAGTQTRESSLDSSLFSEVEDLPSAKTEEDDNNSLEDDLFFGLDASSDASESSLESSLRSEAEQLPTPETTDEDKNFAIENISETLNAPKSPKSSNPLNVELFEETETDEGDDSTYNDEDLFGDLSDRSEGDVAEAKYSEQFMDRFLFGDDLGEPIATEEIGDRFSEPESIVRELPTDAIAVETPAERATPEPKSTEKPPENSSDRESNSEDLFAEFEEETPAIAPSATRQPDESRGNAQIERSPYRDSIDPSVDLDLDRNLESDAYIPASPEENLLVREDSLNSDEHLWLDPTTLEQLDEDLYKLEAFSDSEADTSMVSEEEWLMSESRMEELELETPLLDELNLADGNGVSQQISESNWEVENTEPIPDSLDEDLFAIPNPEAIAAEVEPSSQDVRTATSSESSRESGRSPTSRPSLEDIFADLMANKPTEAKQTAPQEEVSTTTVEEFFASFTDTDDEVEETTEAEIPQTPNSEEDVTNTTLDDFFASWSDIPDEPPTSNSLEDLFGSEVEG